MHGYRWEVWGWCFSFFLWSGYYSNVLLIQKERIPPPHPVQPESSC